MDKGKGAKSRRAWRFGGGTLESNVDGFELLRGDKLRAAIEALPDDDPLKQDLTTPQSTPSQEQE